MPLPAEPFLGARPPDEQVDWELFGERFSYDGLHSNLDIARQVGHAGADREV